MADESVKEFYEEDAALRKKAKKLASWIIASKHMIAFTGAGISTSAGVPDYRGPEGTWTMKDQGKTQRSTDVVCPDRAVPTLTHMVLVGLQNCGALKFVISQNCDGLHLKSGILPSNISEIHGNSNLEICPKCGKEYFRDYDACGTFKFANYNHGTGRYCVEGGCGEELKDTIINFGEHLAEKNVASASHNVQLADLCVVLGTSLTVSSAATWPDHVAKHGGKLVIINLQKTPLDHKAALRVFGKTDEFMKMVMDELHQPIPAFVLHRSLTIHCKHDATQGNTTVDLHPTNIAGTSYSYLKGVVVRFPWGPKGGKFLSKEPLAVTFPTAKLDAKPATISLELQFVGNYDEPPLPLQIQVTPDAPFTTKYELRFHHATHTWEPIAH